MIRLPQLDADSLDFPPVESACRQPDGLLAFGGDLRPARLLAAYARGIFPWYSAGQPILWWSPDPRMVLATHGLHVPRRLQRWLKTCTWSIHADGDFAEVVRACAQPRHCGNGTWITAEMFSAYCRLHELGHAHSLEIRDGVELVGGIYGVAIGRMFFGESMFSRRDHASKLALLALCHGLASMGFPLLDAQVSSDHLRSLGGREMPRKAFCVEVADLTQRPPWRGIWVEHFNAIKPLDLIPRRGDGSSDSQPSG
ncbi:MAG: leucyl/phenylalanyl-tRNA--protein transferase [Gammaproteobacteria bacterium]|nr:MAG: leucyl/phenylalanyl-tRNA--protein transferase [Gammaproteobacteria bacterium]